MYVHPTILAAATSPMTRRPAWRSPLCPCGDIVRDQATGSTVMPPGRARRLTGRHPGKLVATRARCVLTEARTTATQQHCRRVLNEHPELQTCPRQHALPSFMPMTDSSTAPLPSDAHSDLRAEVADQAARLIADGGLD